jgi:uncharacterized protein YkwD
MNQKEIDEITNHINQYRRKHHACDMGHNKTISDFSQRWSNNLISTNKFEHSKNKMYGENLAYSSYPGDKLSHIKNAIDSWYSEIKEYDFNKSTFTSGTGHATALLWKGSTSFGIGYSNDGKKHIVSMNMHPAGNIMGRFKENVAPI